MWWKNTDAKLSILEKLGSLNFRKQIYKEAIRYQKEALELGCKIRGEASLYCGDANKNLGNYYFKIEETDTALEAYESSRSIYQKALPAKDAKLGLISSLIGDCYFAKGNFQKALEYYLQDLEISEFVLGKTSPELGIIFNSIGIAYRNLGKYDLALTYYKKILKSINRIMESRTVLLPIQWIISLLCICTKVTMKKHYKNTFVLSVNI